MCGDEAQGSPGISSRLTVMGSSRVISGEAETSPVTFMISGDLEELQAYQTLLADFQNKRPDIEVTLIHVPGGKEFREKLATMFSANIPPDIFLYNYRRL